MHLTSFSSLKQRMQKLTEYQVKGSLLLSMQKDELLELGIANCVQTQKVEVRAIILNTLEKNRTLCCLAFFISFLHVST